MRDRALQIGISPCPNDVFAFHGLMSGAVKMPGIQLVFAIHDVEELNRRFARGEWDASKVSFFAALGMTRECVVLRAGSALGFGVGPLLLARRNAQPLEEARVLCPGERTTAHFLLRTFHQEVRRIEHTVFSAIMPELERGTADYGVCIHEGRFTYERHGLTLVEDLGQTWETHTRSPLPLGGILARRTLTPEVMRALDDAIQRSIDHARAHPDETLIAMRSHARELDDDVIRAHVDLYVNNETRDLGTVGERALFAFEARARSAGFMPRETPALEVRQ